ncbi:MAG TPA: dihydrofolate reductase family protein [Ktedonobacteraceae bacterium]|nr:dihydrofolate reductase family protein [Ktedonobacteraceae bacterium]
MGKVMFGLSVSLDGLIAGKNDDVSEVFAWMGRAMEQFHEVVGDTFNETGAVIMGRRSFDMIYSENGWIMPDGTPLPWPVIVLQSQAREPVKKSHTQFYFVTGGIESAIKKAQEIAGEKNVALHGGSAVQQALKAGLLDEFHMAVAHVLLGKGVRLFDHIGSKPIHLEHIRTLETPGATHLSFHVVK